MYYKEFTPIKMLTAQYTFMVRKLSTERLEHFYYWYYLIDFN